MPVILSTTVKKIDQISNKENQFMIRQYHLFMKSCEVSERHQNNNLKVILAFTNYLELDSKNQVKLSNIDNNEIILRYLESKRKTKEIDPDQKWISTWNHYFHRIKHFFRWYHNSGYKILNRNTDDDKYFHYQENMIYEPENQETWSTPEFLQKIKEKKTKRLSPYVERELWQKDELFSIIKYEPYKRNKAILSLMWDLNARPHEITLLKIKHIRMKEKYAEGEIPHEAKTGSGPILLTFSFPYVRDWLNEHPFRNEPDARLICNLINGSPIKSDAIWRLMSQLRSRIKRLLHSQEISDIKEREYLSDLLLTKKWNPYCIRHSSITSDSDFLPEYALKKKVRWSMNSNQSSRYIKRRMGEQLKKEILARNGIIAIDELKNKPLVLHCPRCSLVNTHDNKLCSKCSYPLNMETYDEIKAEEDKRMKVLEVKEKQKEEQIKILLEKQEKFEILIQSLIDSGQLHPKS